MTAVDTAAPGPPAGACRRHDCTAAADGVCMVGADDPIDCEFFDLAPDPEEVDEIEASPPTRSLPGGAALRPGGLFRVLSRRQATRVTLLGPIAAGKTTLLAVVFEMLIANRIDDWGYVRSETTLGFMARSHDASVLSRRSEPTTPRTSRAESGDYLHVDVRNRRTDEVGTLLCADVSGEHVEQLVMTGDRAPGLMEAVAEAHHLPILIDGERVADPLLREAAIRSAIDLITTLVDLDRRGDAVIGLVLTKADCLLGDDVDGIAEEVLGRAAQAAQVRLGVDPRTFRVAARPEPDSGVEPGTGLAKLLNTLLEPRPLSREPVFQTELPKPSPRTLRRIRGVHR